MPRSSALPSPRARPENLVENESRESSGGPNLSLLKPASPLNPSPASPHARGGLLLDGRPAAGNVCRRAAALRSLRALGCARRSRHRCLLPVRAESLPSEGLGGLQGGSAAGSLCTAIIVCARAREVFRSHVPDAASFVADKLRAVSPPKARSGGNAAHRQQHMPDIFSLNILLKGTPGKRRVASDSFLFLPPFDNLGHHASCCAPLRPVRYCLFGFSRNRTIVTKRITVIAEKKRANRRSIFNNRSLAVLCAEPAPALCTHRLPEVCDQPPQQPRNHEPLSPPSSRAHLPKPHGFSDPSAPAKRQSSGRLLVKCPVQGQTRNAAANAAPLPCPLSPPNDFTKIGSANEKRETPSRCFVITSD